MEVACRQTFNILLFLPLHIPHAVTAKVMVVAVHTKDPDRVGDMPNIFLFPDLSPLAGS